MVIEQKFKAGEEPDPTEYLFISMEQVTPISELIQVSNI